MVPAGSSFGPCRIISLVGAGGMGDPSSPKFSGHVDVQSLKDHPGYVALLERLRRDWERRRATL